jgi:hypothetical protein
VGVLAAFVPPASACDLHALRTTSAIADDTPGLRLGVAEQWTNYATLQDGDDEIANPDDQYLRSSITHVVGGYRIHERLGVELVLPIIYRRYRRPTHGGRIEDDAVSGVGDMALLADVVAFRRETADSIFRVDVLGGLELPTGNPDRLGEESAEGHHDDDAAHDASGIHGHDLALGSGSVDGIVGLGLSWSWRRAFFTGAVVYSIRGEGSFDYRYADDLQWEAGPGVLVWKGERLQATFQAALSGETKGQDEQRGRPLNDTGATTLYVGPGFDLGWDRLAAEVAVDVPVITHRTAVQIAPDLRVRGGVRWRF